MPVNLIDWLHGDPWEISNVNWWPDFPTTAALAREMFRRQGGGDVAGVVAITQPLLEPLIATTGPVNIPGYPPVAAAGLEQRILDEVELKQPPDTPRHKFLNLLSRQVFERLLHLDSPQLGQVASVASRAAATGDIQAWFADPARQQAVTGTTWSGALPSTDGDFLMLADSNMWASKANKDLVRDVTYTVARDAKQRLIGHVHAVFKNEGVKSTLNPTYLGYVRLYVPDGARLLDASARDEGQAPDGPYRVFSVLVQADPEQERSFDVRYVLPASVAPGGHYRLLWQRQVGAVHDRLVATVLGQSKVADTSARALTLEVGLQPHGLRGFLHDRWLFRRLGL